MLRAKKRVDPQIKTVKINTIKKRRKKGTPLETQNGRMPSGF